MAEKPKYDILDEEGLKVFAKGILDKVNTRINQRIVQTMEIDDTVHVPSSAAVLKAISSSHNLRTQIVIGDIDIVVPIEERSTNILYLQKDNEEDPSWMMYIWDADPTLHPDPNGKWVCIGDTEIDLSNYWSKSPEDMDDLSAQLGVDGLQNDVTSLKADVNDLKASSSAVQDEIADIITELDKKLNYDDINEIPTSTVIRILDDVDNETNPFIETAASAGDIVNIFDDAIASGQSEVYVKLTNDVDLTTGTINVINIPEGVNATLRIPAGNKLTCAATGIQVGAGSTLTLSGSGTIVKTGKGANGAVRVESGSTLNIDGVTIDATTQGKEDNWSYGVYAKGNSTINFRSGVIKVALASCISTNNLTGGCEINILGGELYSDGCYAIYSPAQSTINIKDAIVQGINARMGTINIGGDAKIISTTLDASTCADIGKNIRTSGSIELGDAIALIAGSYSDPNGIDIEVNVRDDATVASNFRSAIGIYLLDTKAAANVRINVEHADAVTTSDASADAITVYDHTYISNAASAAGESYTPVATSTVVLNV